MTITVLARSQGEKLQDVLIFVPAYPQQTRGALQVSDNALGAVVTPRMET